MTQKFTGFQALGQHLGHQSPPSEQNWFTQEERRLKAELLRTRQENDKKREVITLNHLGKLYRDHKKYQQAIEYYEAALKIDPDDYTAMNELGILNRLQGNYSKAIEWFEKILNLDPSHKQAMDGLGITYREMGNYPKAIEQFEKLLTSDSTNKSALAGLTATFEKMGLVPEVVEPLKRRLQANHRGAYAHSQLCKIANQYVANGRLKEAQSITDFLNNIQEELHQMEEEKLFPVTSDRERVTTDSQEPIEEKVKRLETEIKQQEVMVLRARQMAMVGMMTSGLDHEIMSPLQVILGNAQNCQTRINRGNLDKSKILNHLEKIIAATKWIDNVVSHLHVFSRNRKPNPVPVNVNVVIDNALSLFQQQLKARGIDIQKHLTDNLLLVEADQTELEIVIINLINNARDALEGREDKRIIITTQARQSEVQIRVEDNGEGIQPDLLPRIFEPFLTTKEKGAGIGLYTTQQIVQAYNGDIQVSSYVNEMTTFLITFPGIPEKEII
jgi:C4-dicarboxylate-specific signal transduction histidine kinase